MQPPQVNWGGEDGLTGPQWAQGAACPPFRTFPAPQLYFRGGSHGMVAEDSSALCPFSRPAAVLGSLDATGMNQALSSSCGPMALSPQLRGPVALSTSHSDPFSGSFMSLLCHLPPLLWVLWGLWSQAPGLSCADPSTTPSP